MSSYAQEAEASETVLLAARGLTGVKLIIRDEHAGLIAGSRKVLPEVKAAAVLPST